MTPEISRLVVLAGLTPLIPLPFLDTYMERKLLRSAFEKIGVEQGRPLDSTSLDALTADHSSILVGCLIAMVIWPIKKLFRTFFYFLTVKDVIDGIAGASHRVAMVQAALHQGYLPDKAMTVRTAMDQTLKLVAFSPVRRIAMKMERPAPQGWIAASQTDRAVLWFHHHGGGGVVLARFETILKEQTDAPPPAGV